MKIFIVLILLLPNIAFAIDLQKADLVLVKKSERKMYLIKNNKPFKEYKVAFGANPKGHKQQEGDERTPEGKYILDYKKSDSAFYKAIHVESWKDAYSGVMPAEFMAGQIDRDLAQHWREIGIQNQDIVWVAEDDSLVGFVAVWCRPIPFIDNLHVIPSHRSKKIGSALMNAAAKELIKKG